MLRSCEFMDLVFPLVTHCALDIYLFILLTCQKFKNGKRAGENMRMIGGWINAKTLELWL